MTLGYGLFGLFAIIALVVNLAFIIAALSLLQATLTLPGIAGIVLTMGMSVDANVLINERIRDELRVETPISALDAGFTRAYGTIFDTNMTGLLAAVILIWFGSGPVRGFGVTLAIGIIASAFTATTVTRYLVAGWLRWTSPKRSRSEASPDATTLVQADRIRPAPERNSPSSRTTSSRSRKRPRSRS